MTKIQLKKSLLIGTFMICGNTSFAQEMSQQELGSFNGEPKESVEQSIQDLNQRIENDPALNKGLQQLFDTHVKDEATRKRKCARLAAITDGKLGLSPDDAKQHVDEIISGKHNFPGQARQSGKSDVWKKYQGFVRTLERSLFHKGSLNSLEKSELDQIVLDHDSKWKELYNSLKNNSKITATHKSALEGAHENHRQIMLILQTQKKDYTTIKKILPYLQKIKQDLISFPDFTLTDANAEIHSKLSRFQPYSGKQTNLDRSQIDALLADKRANALEQAKKHLSSASVQKQLNEQYKAIATIKEQLEKPLSNMLREQLDCE